MILEKLYSKVGVTIDSGQYFILTGERGRIPGGWEVDKPPYDGIFPHGVALAPITDSVLSDNVIMNVNGPVVLQLTGSVNKGDLLSCNMAGNAKKKIISEALAGVAIKNGITDSYVEAMLFSSFWPSSASAIITTPNPTSTSASWVLIPEMTATINIRAQSRIIAISSINIELQANDDFDVALFINPVGGLETIIDSSIRNSKLGLLGITTHQTLSINEMILNLNPGQYTIQAKWKKNSGTARAIDVQRSLHITGA